MTDRDYGCGRCGGAGPTEAEIRHTSVCDDLRRAPAAAATALWRARFITRGERAAVAEVVGRALGLDPEEVA